MDKNKWIVARLARLAMKLLVDRLRDFGVTDEVVIQIGGRVFRSKGDGKKC